MGDSTPKRSRRDKERGKSHPKRGNREDSQGSSRSDTNDPAVDITLRGTYTINARRVLKKLKWPSIIGGCCICILYAPQIDIQLSPGSPTPVEIGQQQ
ncbi:hypothetical protein ACIBEK_24345 [Nocardia fusca]|uniref:hypothetical protein n=1 Tax=Nocardia fusca TaxID=941183 RepID=UPI00379395D3